VFFIFYKLAWRIMFIPSPEDLNDDEEDKGELIISFLNGYFDAFLIFVARCTTLAVQYGFYSEEMWKLYRNVRLSPDFLDSNQVKPISLLKP